MINISEVKIEKHVLRCENPILTSHGEITERPVILLGLKDKQGSWGFGESSPLQGFSKENIYDVEEILSEWSKTKNEHLLATSSTAKAAVDCAFLDLKAKNAGLPLHKFMNSDSPKEFPVSKLILGETPQQVSSNAEKATDIGYGTLKIKVGALETKADFERLKAVRETVGQKIEIRIDANGGWETNQAIDILGELSPFKIEFVEEPTRGLENLATVRKNVSQKIAIDESLEVENIDLIAENEIADIVIIKPSAIGGISFASQLIRQAENLGLEVVITSFLDGAIGVAASAHLTSAYNLLNPAPGLGTSSLLLDDLAESIPINNGNMILGSSSGLGIQP
jgi:o-succinylbenzoate synthase